MYNRTFFILLATVATVAGLELTIDDLIQPNHVISDGTTTSNAETTTDSARDTTQQTEDVSSPNDLDSTTDALDETTEPESTIRPSVTAANISFTTRVMETEAPTTRLTDRTENVVASSEQTNVVETTYGPVRGFEWQASEDIISYIDIPYAQFTNYFEEPAPPTSWENVHEIMEHTSRCPQLEDETTVGSLDCLTLSVFAPANAMNASVLFHIHESNFVQGSADPALYGPEYLVSKGLILVLPNYRLGPLGFLCLRNTVAPGNAALKDLTMALKWTKDNIVAFGGNPENIVVSGEGSSGALVGFLALSPSSRDYFHKAITESGSVLSYWALDRNPIQTGEQLIEALTVIEPNNRNLEATELLDILRAAQPIHFRPCTETGTDPFMVLTPWGMIREQKVNITFMIGSANYAGLNVALNQNETHIEQLNDDFASLLPGDLIFNSDIERENVVRNVRSQYFEEDEPITLDDHIGELALCFTDACYLGPAIRTARSLANAGATVYFYEFSFTGELNTETDAVRPVDGAVRGDIIKYIFTQDGRVLAEESAEREIVDIMVDTWFSFIENGYPVANETNWNKLTVTVPAQEEWMLLGPDISLNQGLHLDRLNLWTSIYNNYFIEIRNSGIRPILNIYTVIVPLITYFGFRRAPKPPSRWDGIFEATHRVKCPQTDVGDENCLIVNVFTPEISNDLPVLVHFHGGDFQNGWGIHEPSLNFLNNGIITVTFNYRIGVLGFLCLGTSDAPGNVGLKDQVAALYWIQKNIDKFGGDPNDVTLYGTEAGSISVQLLLQSGLKKGLFHKVILESGSVLSPSAMTYNPLKDAFDIGKELQYNDTRNSQKLVKYLQKLPAKLLVDVHKSSLPCIENGNYREASLIEEDPLQVLKQGSVEDIPMLVIYSKLQITHDSDKLTTVPEDFVSLLPSNLDFTEDEIMYKIAELIKDFYFAKDVDTVNSYENYLNDVMTVYPLVKYSVLYAIKNSLNVYLMHFVPEDDLIGRRRKLFDYVFREKNADYNGEKTTKILLELFSNFIKLGDPSPITTSTIPEIWQPVVDNNRRQLRSAVELVFKGTIKQQEFSSHQELLFWDRIYDKFYKIHKVVIEK